MAKKKEAKVTSAQIDKTVLASVVSGTQSAGFIYMSMAKAIAAGLLNSDGTNLSNPLVEFNDTAINPDDSSEIGFRSTPAGNAYMADNTETEAQKKTRQHYGALNVAQIKLEDAIPIPAKKEFGRKSDTATDNLFNNMGVGQSFFLAGDTAYKQLASKVSVQNNKNAVPKKDASGNVVMREGVKRQRQADGTTKTWKEQVPQMEHTKHFVVKEVTENGAVGARVWRES